MVPLHGILGVKSAEGWSYLKDDLKFLPWPPDLDKSKNCYLVRFEVWTGWTNRWDKVSSTGAFIVSMNKIIQGDLWIWASYWQSPHILNNLDTVTVTPPKKKHVLLKKDHFYIFWKEMSSSNHRDIKSQGILLSFHGGYSNSSTWMFKSLFGCRNPPTYHPLKRKCHHMSWHSQQLSNEQNPLTFRYVGLLRGILGMVYSNPHIAGQYI